MEHPITSSSLSILLCCANCDFVLIRMAAFRVMTNCCIRSIYAEQQKTCKTYFSACKLKVEEKWKLFKVAAYYNFLTMLSIPFIGPVLSKVLNLWTKYDCQRKGDDADVPLWLKCALLILNICFYLLIQIISY